MVESFGIYRFFFGLSVAFFILANLCCTLAGWESGVLVLFYLASAISMLELIRWDTRQLSYSKDFPLELELVPK